MFMLRLETAFRNADAQPCSIEERRFVPYQAACQPHLQPEPLVDQQTDIEQPESPLAFEETAMKTLFAITTTGTLLLSGLASAQEFPFYELSGFPISLPQISIIGATTNLKEQSPSTSLTMGGMPASPNQIAVLTRRQRVPEQLDTGAAPSNF